MVTSFLHTISFLSRLSLCVPAALTHIEGEWSTKRMKVDGRGKEGQGVKSMGAGRLDP